MITKNDCLTLLVSLEASGIDVNAQIKKLITAKEIPTEVLKFIIDNKGSEIVNFYEMLRHKHNKKQSPLYHNIVKDIIDPEDIITTLACLLMQITLFSKKLDTNRAIFLREARAEEVSRVLNSFYKSGELEPCISLLRAVKADLVVLEYINGRRDLLKN